MAGIVYLATNRINGKRYVGVTGKTVAIRRRQHENCVNTKSTTCRAFHAAIRKYGKEAFDWIELALCDEFDVALQEEVRLISEIRPEYNLTTGGQGSKGRIVSQAQRDHHSQIMKGRQRSPESIAKMAATNTGRKRSEDARQRISSGRLGMKFSPEHCRNLGLSRKGKKQSWEAIQKRTQSRIGKPLSDEHRAKIRASLLGKKRPPEVIAKMLASRRKFFITGQMA